MTQMTGYLAHRDFFDELLLELEGLTEVSEVYERLVLTSGGPVPSVWAQNVWLNPVRISVGSISQAALELKGIQRNWGLYSVHSHRRAQLISEKLPRVPVRELVFPAKAPIAPMGAWTLLDPNTLLASSQCSSPFLNGEVHFKEDKSSSPSRAYLKLWEAFTWIGEYPGPGSVCLDMGSSPGGWTWVLHELGAKVLSVDKAPLSPKIAELPRVQSLRKDAFTLNPAEVGPVDWFFSDVICYPQKLVELVEKWMRAGNCKRWICTIKFQGKKMTPSDIEAVKTLAAIPGSRIHHLFHNKHELTWFCIPQS